MSNTLDRQFMLNMLDAARNESAQDPWEERQLGLQHDLMTQAADPIIYTERVLSGTPYAPDRTDIPIAAIYCLYPKPSDEDGSFAISGVPFSMEEFTTGADGRAVAAAIIRHELMRRQGTLDSISMTATWAAIVERLEYSDVGTLEGQLFAGIEFRRSPNFSQHASFSGYYASMVFPRFLDPELPLFIESDDPTYADSGESTVHQPHLEAIEQIPDGLTAALKILYETHVAIEVTVGNDLAQIRANN